MSTHTPPHEVFPVAHEIVASAGVESDLDPSALLPSDWVASGPGVTASVPASTPGLDDDPPPHPTVRTVHPAVAAQSAASHQPCIVPVVFINETSDRNREHGNLH
jgi:hypothetical protein